MKTQKKEKFKKTYFLNVVVNPALRNDTRTCTLPAPKSVKSGVMHCNVVSLINSPSTSWNFLPRPPVFQEKNIKVQKKLKIN